MENHVHRKQTMTMYNHIFKFELTFNQMCKLLRDTLNQDLCHQQRSPASENYIKTYSIHTKLYRMLRLACGLECLKHRLTFVNAHAIVYVYCCQLEAYTGFFGIKHSQSEHNLYVSIEKNIFVSILVLGALLSYLGRITSSLAI